MRMLNIAGEESENEVKKNKKSFQMVVLYTIYSDSYIADCEQFIYFIFTMYCFVAV